MHDLDHKDLVVAPSPALQGFAERPFAQLLHSLILDVESAPGSPPKAVDMTCHGSGLA